MKKIMSIAIVAAMLSVSFAVGVSLEARAGTDYIEGVPVPWDTDFTPLDIAWNDAGTIAVVVGQTTGATTLYNAWAYYPHEAPGNQWRALTSPETYLQPLKGVAYDGMTNTFWICGNPYISETSTVFSWNPAVDKFNMTQDYPLVGSFDAVAVDTWGNPLIAGDMLGGFYYLDVYNGAGGWTFISASELSTAMIYSVDFNSNDHRFYAVGELQPGKGTGGTKAMVFYTDTTDINPLNATSQIHKDSATELDGIQYFNSIAWNQAGNYGLAVGSEIWKCSAVSGGVINWTMIADEEYVDVVLTQYWDVAWDPDGYGEAAIVGTRYNMTMGWDFSYYWRYIPSQGLLPPELLSTSDIAACVAFKPPASPKFPFVPLAGGGFVIKVNMVDQSTTITANAVFPKLYWIGFNDSGGTPRMDQQVAVDDWYQFTLFGNYSQDWVNCRVEVRAWYDWGQVGNLGLNYPAETEDQRVLAFRLYYWASNGTYIIMYPTGPLEITIGLASDVNNFDNPLPGQENHTVTLPVYFGSQLRWADGGGFSSGDPPFDSDPNVALQDPGSWNFNVTLRDDNNPTAANVSYGEFGIQETVSISVAGNPAGNAPPGTLSNPMSNPSQITYSANTLYWVNVSIPDLLKGGTGPDLIAATNVNVSNSNLLSSDTYSDINGAGWPMGRPFAAANTPWSAWGNSTTSQWMPAPSNGTVSFGPWGSDYNAGWVSGGVTTTQLDWWVTVPAGTPEGIYSAIITIQIDS